jgi:ribonucleoside-diphosphate reductase alpha chain
MSVITSTPGQIQVIKRTGDVAAFDAEKISVAIGKAFLLLKVNKVRTQAVSTTVLPN